MYDYFYVSVMQMSVIFKDTKEQLPWLLLV